MTRYGDVAVESLDGHVSLVELRRGPHNFFDVALLSDLADALEALDADAEHRVSILAAEGKNFCAGADFSARLNSSAKNASGAEKLEREIFVEGGPSPLYAQAVRLFAIKKHVVAAIQGAAIGGGLGLALAADFRVGGLNTRFAANFAKLGITPGFGLTHTLPRLIGAQAAAELFATARRVSGEEAARIGLLDRFASDGDARGAAIAFAREIAANAPLALAVLKETARGDLPRAVREATGREAAEQARLVKTADHAEGVRAVAERRPAAFTNR
ncbi:MAG: enoyl-CoA hydratase/isomerase family protein [Pseudomonadota bacterium]